MRPLHSSLQALWVLHAGLVNERAFERWLVAAGQDPWRLKVALVLAHSIWMHMAMICDDMMEVKSHLLWQQAARALLAAEQPEAALDAVLALAVQQAREVEVEAGCVEASRGCCSGRALLPCVMRCACSVNRVGDGTQVLPLACGQLASLRRRARASVRAEWLVPAAMCAWGCCCCMSQQLITCPGLLLPAPCRSGELPYLVEGLRHLVMGFTHIAFPMPGQVSASPLPSNAAQLASRLASRLLCSQAFRGALAQRLERLHRNSGSPGRLTELLLEASQAASNCCRNGSELGLVAIMTDQRLVAAAAQLVEQLSLRGDLVGGRRSARCCCCCPRSTAAQQGAQRLQPLLT
jgi:hypothetical protein